MGVDLDAWIEKLKRCEYLEEDELKSLCEYVRILLCPPGSSTNQRLYGKPGLLHDSSSVQAGYTFIMLKNKFNLLLISIDVLQIKEILVEESNVQPVNSPVTV